MLFSSFDPKYRRNIILFYLFGDCAAHVSTLVSGKQGEDRRSVLREFFEPYYSKLPNWHKADCTPVRFLATEWSNDRFAGNGSYCNFQVGVDKADEHVRNLRHGMPEHGIYFAGEHTSPFDGLGTVAGAYTSGQRVAERLVESFGSPVSR